MWSKLKTILGLIETKEKPKHKSLFDDLEEKAANAKEKSDTGFFLKESAFAKAKEKRKKAAGKDESDKAVQIRSIAFVIFLVIIVVSIMFYNKQKNGEIKNVFAPKDTGMLDLLNDNSYQIKA
jgi:G:T/U-mismatch repair DNA glycosylase